MKRLITPNDLRNPKRKSGFNFVVVAGPNSHWNGFAAQFPASVTGSSQRQGPRRPTALEAAQDYCDYVNNAPLTIEDIRNPKRKSGFDHVTSAGGQGKGHGGGRPWAATWGRHDDPSNPHGRGPRRADPAVAAQDYCDHENNAQQGPRPTAIIASDKLRFPRHPRKAKTASGVKAVPRTKRSSRPKEGPGWVYCLGMIGHDAAVKVGESSDEAMFRLHGLQTGNPYELYVIWSFYTQTRIADEAALHAKWVKYQQDTDFVGEWFTRHDEIIDYKPAAQSGGRPKEVKEAA